MNPGKIDGLSSPNIMSFSNVVKIKRELFYGLSLLLRDSCYIEEKNLSECTRKLWVEYMTLDCVKVMFHGKIFNENF